jgi:hypothetical protein
MTNKTNKNKTSSTVQTAFIVREANSRRFLTRPTYSGRVQGVWGTISEAATFETREEAQSCASNINARRPEGYSAYYAEVRTVEVPAFTRR